MKFDTIKRIWEVPYRNFQGRAITRRHMTRISLTCKTEFPILMTKKKVLIDRMIQPQMNKNGGIIMAEKKIGEVVKFFSKPSVAAVKIVDGELKVGDSIKFSGHTTDFTDVVNSMEVDNKSVPKAVAGDFIGVKVSDRVRPGDEVFKVIPD
jgi:putative protease